MVFKLLKKDIIFLFSRKLNVFIAVCLLIGFLFDWNGFSFFLAMFIPMLTFELDKDIAFHSVLPVTKKQILISKLLFMVIVQLIIILLSCLSALLSSLLPYVNKAEFSEVGYKVRLLLLMFTFLNFVTCIALRNCEKIFAALCAALISLVMFFLLLVGIQYVLEQAGVMKDGVFNSILVNDIFTAVVFVLYPILTILGYRLAENSYDNTDLFDRNEL